MIKHNNIELHLKPANEEGYWEEHEEEENKKVNIPSVEWEHGKGLGSWQGKAEGIQSRTAYLYNKSEMSDLDILVVDENWWFGDTVKDFVVIKTQISNTVIAH